jgi:hypothetical protein
MQLLKTKTTTKLMTMVTLMATSTRLAASAVAVDLGNALQALTSLLPHCCSFSTRP